MVFQILIGLVVCLSSMTLALYILKWTSPGPKGLGISTGGLKPCENSPNCVCSEDFRPGFKTERIPFNGLPEPDFVRKKLSNLPRTTIIKVLQGPANDPVVGEIAPGGFYVHAESRSLFIGFVDDIQIYWNPGFDGLQIRSSSRAGYSDLGVNRARISRIRSLMSP